MYGPKIREDLIKKLYRLGRSTGQPMTRVVDRILRRALDGVDYEHPIPEGHSLDQEDGLLLKA